MCYNDFHIKYSYMINQDYSYVLLLNHRTLYRAKLSCTHSSWSTFDEEFFGTYNLFTVHLRRKFMECTWQFRGHSKVIHPLNSCKTNKRIGRQCKSSEND